MSTWYTDKPSWYTVRILGGRFAIVKLDDWLLFIEGVYYLYKRPKGYGYECTCPAGSKPHRHWTIYNLFLQEGKIDTGWFYCYDTQEWRRPLNAPTVRELKLRRSLGASH